MIEFQSVDNVVGNAQATVLSFTNTASIKFINSITVEGSARSEWDVYLNLVKIDRIRTSVSKLNRSIRMFSYKLEINDIIEVKVTHYESTLNDFSSEFNYV